MARLSCQTALGCACVISCSAMRVLTQFPHPLHSLLLQLFIWSQGRGRKKKNPGDSRVHSHSSPPPHTASLSSPRSKLQFISVFFFPSLSFFFCHKSKAWICSALFCNPQSASSIGDYAAGNCLCAVLAPHFCFWIIYILGTVFYFYAKSGETLMLWYIK